MIIHLVYTPIMIRLLGQSEYGLYTLVGSVVSYLGLFSLGFSGAYLRFYSRYSMKKDTDGIARLNGMFLSLFLTMSAIALLCGITLSQFTFQLFGTNLTAEELREAKLLMQILVVNISLTFPCSIFDSIVSAHEQFFFQRMLSLAGILFNPLICLPLLLLGHGSVAIVSTTTGITVTKLCVNMWYCRNKLRAPFNFHNYDWSLMKEIAGFSFFVFLNMIIDQVNWSVDKYILGRVSGTAAVAIYGVGAQINALYTSFSSSISSVFAPRVNRIAAEGLNDKTRKAFTELLLRVGRIQFMVLALICSAFVIFGKYFITNIYATSEYAMAYPVALLLIVPVTIPLIQNLGLEIQRAVNMHKVRSIVYFFMAIANILVSIPLAIRWGPVGSAFGTSISLLLANGLIMNVYYYKAIGIDIPAFWKSIGRLAIALPPCAVVGMLILRFVTFSNVFVFAAWVLVYTLVYMLSFWLIGLNFSEKRMVLNVARNFMQHIAVRKK